MAERGGSYDIFGTSVALIGDTALVTSCPDEEKGAVYVFVREGDTWTQQASLRPHDGERRSVCGTVALAEDTALVRSSTVTNGKRTGAVYVFVREDGIWSQQATLLPDDGDSFDSAVALAGETALVGAAEEVDVFVRKDGTWSQRAKLFPDDGARDDGFGSTVALAGETALVGVPNTEESSGANTGALYVFERRDTTWDQRTKVQPWQLQDGDGFGGSVALDGETALIGAAGTDRYTGAAYVFQRSEDGWDKQAKLLAPEPLSAPRPAFGASVALSGDVAIIGTVGHNDPNREEPPLPAYVFARNDSSWTQQARLLPEDGDLEDGFGAPVALADGVALVGAPRYDTADESDVGAAFVFE
jgi:hypothetical protein